MLIKVIISVSGVIALWCASVSSAGLKPNVAEIIDDLFPVSIIHINDFHARFEETNERSTSCKSGEKCIGGYARAVALIKELMETRKHTNPIYLNAGDNFQGTLWYSVGRWNVTSYFLNLLKADAITLGNHEFDHEIAGVVPFLETIQSPMVVSNVDDSQEPSIQGKYNKSVVIDRYGRKIGVIGVILSTTDEIANTEKLRFTNESIAVREEAARLKSEGVDIIIVLSHCGLDVDYTIARNAGPDVDVIVGGHSHTFMYTTAENEEAPGPDTPKDNYPAVVTHEDGHRVLIVQASAYLKYVGDITVYFDKDGHVHSFEGAPIFLDESISQDPEILKELIPWREIMNKQGNRDVGELRVPLMKPECSYHECNLGNFITDAFVHHYATASPPSMIDWTPATIALMPVGGLRTTLSKGTLTYNDLITTIPFENTVDTIELSGRVLRQALEYSVSETYDFDKFNMKNLMHVSGLRMVYNVTNPPFSRVVSVDVLSTDPEKPMYKPLNDTKMYGIITQSFVVNGGDGFKMITENAQNHKVGPIDIDIALNYLKFRSPLMIGTSGRITVLE